jgi:hypothetical protein
MPLLPPAHHETSKRDSPNELKIKGKTTKPIPDSNSNLTKSMTHHTSNQGIGHLVSQIRTIKTRQSDLANRTI